MSERNRVRESPPISVIEDLPGEVHQDIEVSPQNGVREPSIRASPAPALAEVSFSPAHPLNRLITQLNEKWRVVDDPLQWILQQRKGNPRKKNSGWRDRSFCRTREGLSRCVRDYCGEIDAAAFAKLDALPDHYEDWRAIQNLDGRGTDQVHGAMAIGDRAPRHFVDRQHADSYGRWCSGMAEPVTTSRLAITWRCGRNTKASGPTLRTIELTSLQTLMANIS
jgi:hypothetical protein